MVKLVWKKVNGNGPYAYLQSSERDGDKVRSRHVAYLGLIGERGLVPGKRFSLSPDVAEIVGMDNVYIHSPPSEVNEDLRQALQRSLGATDSSGNVYVDDANGTRYWVDDKFHYHRDDGPAVEYADGTKEWYKHGQLHRTDGPAVVSTGKDLSDWWSEWWQDGKRHRDDGPAVIQAGHMEAWYQDGMLHREGGEPAVSYQDGEDNWYQHGRLHREDGAAITWQDGTQLHYQNGLLHREDGPAVIRADGSETWYNDGKAIPPPDGWYPEYDLHSGNKRIKVEEDGAIVYIDQQGLKHRDDGPAQIDPDGTVGWYQHGVLHREDGPALIIPRNYNLTKYFQNEKEHREDGPAFTSHLPDGRTNEIWYKHGKAHRDDGPAMVTWDGHVLYQRWYQDNKLHRMDGPAVITGEGYREWWIDGNKIEVMPPGKPDLIPDSELQVRHEDQYTVYYDKDGNIHRDLGPAMIGANGEEIWYSHGTRLAAPKYGITSSGTASDDDPDVYIQDDPDVDVKYRLIEREGGQGESTPYLIEMEDTIVWLDENDLPHRVDGPAMEESNGVKSWWRHGQLHREDGPAYIDAKGYEEWWINGQMVEAPEWYTRQKYPVAPKAGIGIFDPANPPKLLDIPVNKNGNYLISMANVLKLEKAAENGDVDHLESVGAAIMEKFVHNKARKAAIANAVADLKGQIQGYEVLEGENDSLQADIIDAVDSGQLDLPDQSIPSHADQIENNRKLIDETKDYNKDLELISGQRGGNPGGLFKDRVTQTLHYVKWPNTPLNAKIEALAASLYAQAGVLVPSVRYVEFQGKPAVISDWVDDAKPMSLREMSGREDVRENFAVSAWLANWDVVGGEPSNTVKVPSGQSYCIDAGGSILFRAMGGTKRFDDDAPEMESMRTYETAPKASIVYDDLTEDEMQTGIIKVASVSDYMIDKAVDKLEFPMSSPDYPASKFGEDANNIPQMLKDRLKARRDHIVNEYGDEDAIRHSTAIAMPRPVHAISSQSREMIADSIDLLQNFYDPNDVKYDTHMELMRNELGAEEGEKAHAIIGHYFGSWKDDTIGKEARILKWAAGESMGNTGDREINRMRQFERWLTGVSGLSRPGADEEKVIDEITRSPDGKRLVRALQVSNGANYEMARLLHPNSNTITVYRVWPADLVKYIGIQNRPVGSIISLEDPPISPWSTNDNLDINMHHGAVKTRAEIPMENIILTDVLNNFVSEFLDENEVVFKGIPDFKMEIIKKY